VLDAKCSGKISKIPGSRPNIAPSFRQDYCFGDAVGKGGARRSASDTTAIDRAPFFPTERTAK
jgi:hypothetical protein